MWQIRSILLTILFLSSLSSGCLSNSQDASGIDLIVNYETTNGTIVESYIDGEYISTANASLEFEFSNSTSNAKIVEFGIDPMDGRSSISVDPNVESTIIIEFTNHGIYEINAYAIDEKNHQENITIVVRIDLKIEWSEFDTHEPISLIINPIPNNGGTSPSSIVNNSTVENPELVENVGGGQEVEVTWFLVDPQEDTCQSQKGFVHEGERVTWKTIHFNTLEIHELRLSYDEGQDYIDVYHSISIEYS